MKCGLNKFKISKKLLFIFLIFLVLVLIGIGIFKTGVIRKILRKKCLLVILLELGKLDRN